MLALLFYPSFAKTQVPLPDNIKIGMPNPADEYCTTMGGFIYTYKTPEGYATDCAFDDFSFCDSWAFFQGRCGEPHSICAFLGLDTHVEYGGGRFSEYTAYCKHGDAIVGSVEKLAMADLGSGVLAEHLSLLTSSENFEGPDLPIIPLDPDFSWRNHNGHDWMTSVKNQAGCGSCWAFSAVGIVEAIYNIATGNPNLDLDLSEEYLLSDCYVHPEDGRTQDCCGGWSHHALAHVRDIGIPDELCMEYDELYYWDAYGTLTERPCSCSDKLKKGGLVTECSDECSGMPNSCSRLNCIDACTDIDSRRVIIENVYKVEGHENIKTALVTHGPISVSYTALAKHNSATSMFDCSDCWDRYNSGTCHSLKGTCVNQVCVTGAVGDNCQNDEECNLQDICVNDFCTFGDTTRECNKDLDCVEDKNNDGVCDLEDCELNHSVIITGYDDTIGAWEVKNSWGTGVGGGHVNGYFYMAYGDCFIEDHAYYVVPSADQTFTQTFWDENASDWSLLNGQGTMLENTTHFTKGTASMEADGFGFRTYESTPISTDLISGATSLFMDLFIGSQQTNPHWIGQIQLYVHSPSAGIDNEFQEHIDLTGLPQDEFTEIQFNLSYAVQQALLGSYDDFSIRIAFNTNWGSGPFLIDNIEFL